MSQPLDYVTTQAALDEWCRRWRDAGAFAFDTEFIRDETYLAALCLVQVATGDGVVLVDPVGEIDLAPFWALVVDPAVQKVVHAGKEDFDICLRAAGAPPRNVFDVQIAAGFAGLGYPLNLGRLVQLTQHKRLAKGQTLTDWLRRPLTEDQLHYAVEDVLHLPAIAASLAARIAELGRTSWAREEFARFEEEPFYRPAIEDRLFKFKGARSLDGRSLAVLQRLIDWRDRWAAEKNRPIRAMMRDDILLEVARRRPTKASQVEVLRGFPQSRNPRIIQQILDIVADAAKLSREELPHVDEPREEPPMVRAAIDLLSGFLRATCDLEKLDYELIGGVQRIRDLIEQLQGTRPEKPQLLRGWRAEFAGGRLVDLLEGRSSVRLTGWPGNLALRSEPHGRSRGRISPPAGNV